MSNSLIIPFGSTVTSPMEENGLPPLECRSESALRLKAAWNCPLHMLAFPFIPVLRNGLDRVSLEVVAETV